MLKEFREFALRGNVTDLAIGVVIGASFNAIVTSLVADVFMPIIGIITGGLNFSGLSYKFGNAIITYGKFIQAVFIFVITAFVLFLFVKLLNKLKRKEANKPAATAEVPADIKLLIEIRDLLKKDVNPPPDPLNIAKRL